MCGIDFHVPLDHLLRAIYRFVDLSGIRTYLGPFYSSTGRPSIDPGTDGPDAVDLGYPHGHPVRKALAPEEARSATLPIAGSVAST